MKVARIILFTLLAALVAVGVSTISYAFHSGGVAECAGCHSMHSPAAGGNSLLVGTDQSSTCLSCHQHAGDTGPSSYHVSTADADMPAGVAPLQRTPGGDFGWLKKAYSFLLRGEAILDDGPNMGHDITAVDFGYTGRSNNLTAPGGTFPTPSLGCTSCHDPHGRTRRLVGDTLATTGAPIKASGSYNGTGNEPDANGAVGVYRLLAGPGYIAQGAATFTGAPAAKVPSTYNRTESATSTRVAYGANTSPGHQTWGDWCATCHPSMHSSGNYVHPVDQQLGTTVANNYNAYVKSGDMTGGAGATAFTSLVPFASAATYGALATATTSTAGPASGDRVMCLSCHRAHASGFIDMLRWEQEYEFMTKVIGGAISYGGTDVAATDNALSRGRTNAEKVASYYDRPATQFATYQRVLCNKCHAKD